MVLLFKDPSTYNGQIQHLYVARVNITTVSSIWSRRVHSDSGLNWDVEIDGSNVYVVFDKSNGQLVIMCQMFLEDGRINKCISMSGSSGDTYGRKPFVYWDYLIIVGHSESINFNKGTGTYGNFIF